MGAAILWPDEEHAFCWQVFLWDRPHVTIKVQRSENADFRGKSQ